MTDTLLQELSNTDLDWMITHGKRSHIPEGHQLLDSRNGTDSIYVLIEGKFDLSFVPFVDSHAQKTSIGQLTQGEIVGIGPLFGRPEINCITTAEPSLVMSMSVSELQAKLREDIAFAAHFHRAIAIMLSDRLRRIFEDPERIRFWGERSVKEVLSVFGELRDSDVDWLASFGATEAIAADKVLLQAGRPVDALYVLLDGQMSISSPGGKFNPLYLCFSGLENSTRDQKAFATLSKGSMPGIISFLDFRPLPVTIRAVKESLVYAVPRQTLVTKLQADNSFASRFYRLIAIEILELLHTVSTRLVDPHSDAGPPDIEEHDEELDMEDLQQMSEGAKKFNWMLSQLGVTQDG
ncbi:cyclic nucleotide-binding domain-containing protein [Oscillatoria sp. CS-180]|uniref:cyclic nucleotide-binding domain-containing protein n=1 Tax=Oscillatoria sp. CS-180 TaxID=3021720 RepID=UPI00232B6E69|nr:cyclic nucleotide-binding domain-containing protein [Oscillatoria sp. CS-180]MDB9527500.1 cyclic nucleotide-binding domain-containing protein [Oscillatoria sp. CS-180]